MTVRMGSTSKIVSKLVSFLTKGPSLNYVSIFEGGRGHKMLTDAYLGEGGVFEMLM